MARPERHTRASDRDLRHGTIKGDEERMVGSIGLGAFVEDPTGVTLFLRTVGHLITVHRCADPDADSGAITDAGTPGPGIHRPPRY